jgi:hypothetical protein
MSRVIWLVLVGLTLVILAMSVPARYEQLTTLSFGANRAVQQLTIGEFALLKRFGIDVSLYATLVVAVEVVVQVIFILLGIMMFARESRNWVAMYVALGLITYAAYAVPTLDALLGESPAAAIASRFIQSVGLMCALTFFFVFPDGRMIPRWTIPVSVLWLVMTWTAFFFPGVPWYFLEPWNISTPVFFFLMAWWSTGLIAQLIRLRQTSNPTQRQQAKWVVYSVVLAVIGYAVTYLPRLFVLNLRLLPAISLAYSTLSMLLFYVTIVSIPVAMTFSILRYRLWDIDRLIGQTLLYGVTSAALVAIYIGAVLIIQQLIRVITDERGRVESVVVTTVAVALIAQPLRNRIQTAIDRRFFRARYDAALTVEAFGRTARETVDLGQLTAGLADVVQSTLHPSHLSLWLRARDARTRDVRAHDARSALPETGAAAPN